MEGGPVRDLKLWKLRNAKYKIAKFSWLNFERHDVYLGQSCNTHASNNKLFDDLSTK